MTEYEYMDKTRERNREKKIINMKYKANRKNI